jgi:hypothetical protein
MTSSLEQAWQHQAFADAIKELYKRHPLPKYKYAKVAWQRKYDRDTAVYNARTGSPLYMIDIFAVGVPRDELAAVHTLIFG